MVFQLLLVLGVPWGEYTLGGRWPGKLPPTVRLAPALSTIVLGAFCIIVLARSGLAFGAIGAPTSAMTWVVVVTTALACVANYATPSARERTVWLPVVALMLVTSSVVAVIA